MRNKLTIISLNLIILINFSFASVPKYYYSIDKYIGEYFTYEIYSINLETGVKELAMSAENNVDIPFILSDHSKIFFQCKNKICVYDHLTSTVNTLLHLGNIEELGNIYLNPSINEVYLEFIKVS